ncbi:nucleoside deaminase [Virgibacillus salexigens]|uniref:nucleoside deaminase n=1 Tax=Virgibacillus salexigens TaxID=61016 RepID=UPI00190E3284|nr:nucleoside deaminase [Virgibacillus salexigens]
MKLEFMKMAVELAVNNVKTNNGGPFGAVVVRDGKVIGEGCNQVTVINDPTAHAEVQAIRNACKHVNDFQLADCEIYTSCEPCPMCMGAIYWARPKAVYFAATKKEAADAGFDDAFIYQELDKPIEKRKLTIKQMQFEKYNLPFESWLETDKKVEY